LADAGTVGVRAGQSGDDQFVPLSRDPDSWVSIATEAALATVEFPVSTEAMPGFYQTVLRE
jgi:hypothetical protein